MRAAVCRAHGEPLSVEDVRVGDAGPGQVRVDIRVCAICHSDITYAAGAWGGATPVIYGHEAAGIVESVGEGVGDLTPGQRVVVGLLRACGGCFHCVRGEENLCVGSFDESSPFSDASGASIHRGLNTGAFSEQTVVHRSQVVGLPSEVPLEAGALLACGVLTGFGAVANTAAMPAGSSAAVVGAGGVGLGAIQGSRIAEARQVIAIDLVDDKLEGARRFGATETINAASEDAVAGVRDLTDGMGPDFVFVTVGASAAIDQGLDMVRRGGTLVLVGMPASGVMTEFEPVELADRSQRIIGSKMGSGRMSQDVPKLIDLYRDGQLDLDGMVSNRYPLDSINEAVDEVLGGSVIRNLIVFD